LIRETSFCPVGVDCNTTAAIMSNDFNNSSGQSGLNFKKGEDMTGENKVFSREEVTAAENQGLKLGAEGERDRIRSIVASKNAEGRGKQALAMALDTDLTPEQADKLLMAMPKDKPAIADNQFADHMEKIGNANVAADPAEPTEDEKQMSIASGWARAYGIQPQGAN